MLLLLLSSILGGCLSDSSSTLDKETLVVHEIGEYHITIDVLQIKDSMFSLAAVALVNSELASLIKETIEEFKNNHTEILKYGNQDPRESTLYIAILPSCNGDLVNFEIRNSAYIRGCAHGYNTIQSITYSLSNQKIMRLADLFKEGDNYLAELCEKSRAALKEHFLRRSIEYTDIAETGTAPLENNYATWAITDAGLEIIFNPHQVTPGCNGEQRIVVKIA